MRKHLMSALAVGALVAAMVPKVVGAAEPTEADCLAEAEAASGINDPSLFDPVIVGTNGNDSWTLVNDPKGEFAFTVVCGFRGRDHIDRMIGDVIFVGGRDDDSVGEATGSVQLRIYAGAGDDEVGLLDEGHFEGGTGDDSVDVMDGRSFFRGGGGDDSVGDLIDGTFIAENGNDSAGDMGVNSLFHGGRGHDQQTGSFAADVGSCQQVEVGCGQ